MNKKNLTFVAALFISISYFFGCSGGGGSSGSGNISCPTGYVSVPALSGYTSSPFCVAKFEMKSNSGAKSEADGTPWVSIDRANAITACQSIGVGYDLISNNQWQTVARNIADVADNWSTGVAYNAELSRGHTDNVPASALAADASDVNACANTGQACSDVVWSSQRRTFKLSNGFKIWDFAGNVAEWVKDDNASAVGADSHLSIVFSPVDERQIKFGNDQFCVSPTTSPYCGFGYGYTNYSDGGIVRGDFWADGTSAGLFSAFLQNTAVTTSPSIGFRCIYQP